MIFYPDRIGEIVGLLPTLGGFEVNFYPAKDSNDVNQYLSLKDQPYPLIIMVLKNPSKYKDRNTFEISREVRFVLAVAEKDRNKLNTDRWNASYKNWLNPLAEKWLEALEVSTISRLHEGFELMEVPNYADASEHNQIDIWDTIVIDCTVSINNNCLKPITWE